MPQDTVIPGPKRASQRQQPDNKSEQYTQRHQIPQGLSLEEARVRVSFHRLEHVILRVIEDLRVVAALVFDGGDHAVDHGLGKYYFALGAGQDESVEDFLGAGAEVRAGDGVAGGVGVEVGGGHEGGARAVHACVCAGAGVGGGGVGAALGGGAVGGVPACEALG